ncbi:CidA/LrgA family protein [Erwinia amylovora]|uniref:CidA/LrgA family protein n=1 Tax=Erwinia amylovora TaxID=552 RepID=UPI000C089A9F|nr:CidA/LrgA family protein [Erwinia amylovora]
MRSVLHVIWRYLRAMLIIYLCLYVGRGVAMLLPLAIPGSILGMLLLLILLSANILPLSWVKPGCHLLIRYMALLLVPISVGIMDHMDIISAQFAPIVISCTVGTLVVLVTTALVAQRMERRHHQRQGDKDE